jgi:hypothetical protein
MSRGIPDILSRIERQPKSLNASSALVFPFDIRNNGSHHANEWRILRICYQIGMGSLRATVVDSIRKDNDHYARLIRQLQ